MEVRPGHKLIEVGVIPEDWEALSIGELERRSLLRLYRGNVISKKEMASKPGDFPVYSSSVHNDGIFGSYGRYMFDEELITWSIDGGGHFFYRPPHRFSVTNVCGYMRVQGSDINYRFLSYQLQQLHSRQSFDYTLKAHPSVIRGIYIVPLPPVSEQEAIAEALSDADTLIQSLEQLIAKKHWLKQGAMQELLRPKSNWRMEKLESIAEVIDPHPSHRAPPEVPNGIPFVGIGDLSEEGEIIGTKIRRVHPSVFEEHRARYDLSDELIGLGRVASIGKVVKLRDTGAKYAVSPTLGVIRGTKARRAYLLHALKSRAIVDQFARIMSGSTRSSVGMVVLRRLDIGLPPTDAEQVAIAAILSDMDAEIVALETKLAKARGIKQGMMHELLTGRIRLV